MIFLEKTSNFRGYLYAILQVLLSNIFNKISTIYAYAYFSELIKIGLNANNAMLTQKFHPYKISQSNSSINSIIEQLPCTG